MSYSDDFIFISADEYCLKVTDGTHDSPKRTSEGKYLITSKHIKERSINYSEAYLISEEDYNKINLRSKVDQWDVLISMIGAYCGFCYVERNSLIEYAIKNVGILKAGNKLKAEWLYYYLNSNKGKNYLETIKAGSTQPYISLGELKKIPIPVPKNEETMKKIVDILSSIDEKIELNNEMNRTLEEIAQALFKRWFVDFEFPNGDGEPYKSSCGAMVESVLGMIPKGWEVKNIQDIGEVIAGGTPSTKNEEYYDGNIPWITPKDLSGYDRKFISKGERSITELGLQKSSAKLVRKGTVLFSSRAPIGYIAIAEEDVTTNQGFKSIACNEDIINNNYVYYYLKFNKEKIENVASGSTFKEVSGATMKMFDILVPTINILNKFKNVVEAYDDIFRANYVENDTLIQLRDSLLPKLMSGEIRVEEIEANL